MTKARGLDRFLSASKALSVLCSWTISIAITRITEPTRTKASSIFPNIRYNTAQETRRMNIGSLKTPQIILNKLRRFEVGNSL